MSSDFIKNIFEKAKEERLFEEKKNSIRNNVLLFIKQHPIKSAKVFAGQRFFRLIYSYVEAIKPKENSVIFKPKIAVFVALLFLILFGAGIIGVKAESALPGNMFYPIKTGINEKIMSVFAFSKEAKVDLSIQLVSRRLEEAEKLMVKGRINNENQTQISDSFSRKIKEAVESINNLNDEKKHDIAAKSASNLEASLKAHRHILENLKENDKIESPINNLINRINDETSKTSDIRKNSISELFGDSNDKKTKQYEAVYDKLEKAEKSIIEIKKFIKKRKNKIGSDAALQIESNLEMADKKIIEGKKKVWEKGENYKESFSLFQEAIIISEESKNLAEAKNNLGIEINIRIKSNGKNINDKNGEEKESNETGEKND